MIRRALDAVLDRSILFDFDRTGFERHARRFRHTDTAVNLAGRTALVTGANSGIGRATARTLAALGADVWLLCRNEERGRAAQRDLGRETGSARIFLARLDISDLDAVRRIAAEWPVRPIDLLVHNAGVLPARRQESAQGIEQTLATHVVGPFLLTRLLESRLREAAAARVVFVSSGGMYSQRLSCNDSDWRQRPYDGVRAYAQTKRMQVVLARMFAEAWCDSNVSIHAMHTGWADTPAVQRSLPGFHSVTRRILRTPEQGADTVSWLCTAPGPAHGNGGFWFDRRRVSPYLLPGTRELSSERQRFWSLCEALSDRKSLRTTGGGSDPTPLVRAASDERWLGGSGGGFGNMGSTAPNPPHGSPGEGRGHV